MPRTHLKNSSVAFPSDFFARLDTTRRHRLESRLRGVTTATKKSEGTERIGSSEADTVLLHPRRTFGYAFGLVPSLRFTASLSRQDIFLK